MNENFLGIAGGIAAGFFGSKLLSGKAGASIPAEIDEWANKIMAYDTLAEVALVRKPLFSYIAAGMTFGFYAFVVSGPMVDGEAVDNPEVVMSVVPSTTGCHYEFASQSGGQVDIYYGSETTPRLSVVPSQSFAV